MEGDGKGEHAGFHVRFIAMDGSILPCLWAEIEFPAKSGSLPAVVRASGREGSYASLREYARNARHVTVQIAVDCGA